MVGNNRPRSGVGDAMRCWSLVLVLAGLSALAPAPVEAGPRARVPPRSVWKRLGDDHPTPAPNCFAFSPRLRAYACLGWLADDDGGPVGDGWLDLVGASTLEAWPAWRSRGRRPSTRKAAARLAALGFESVPLAHAELPAGTWVDVDDLAVRYAVDVHEGDASFEYVGAIEVRCPADGADAPPRELDVRTAGLELGELAVAWWAPGSGTVAISVHGIDGGEGVERHTLGTVVIDHCALSGPIAGRALGP